MTDVAGETLRVAMPCTGLGRERRGFERFTRDLHATLRRADGLAVRVYGGGGALLPDERAVWNLPRASAVAKRLARAATWDSYFVEQASFFAGFLPHLAAWRPHLIYFADLNFGNACWHWRQLSGQRFHLLYYNGGATTQPYTRCDWVQQLTPEHFEAACTRGEARERMVVLPHGVDVTLTLAARDPDRVAATRRSLGVPEGRALLLSVGMLDCTIKRMDALIDAVASMGADRPFLVLLGATTEETPRVRERAAVKLGDDCCIGTWRAERMAEAYEAADAFALLSLREGFGLAYAEALAAGLPCVVHDTLGTRYLFGGLGLLGDTRDVATVANLVRRALAASGDTAARRARHAHVRDQFSWDALAPRYAELFRACATGDLPAWSAA